MLDENEIDTPEVTETETSLRDDIEASLADLTPSETPEPVETQADEPEPVEPGPAPDGRERDAQGRFIPKKTAAPSTGAVEPVAGEKPVEVAPAAPTGAPVTPPPTPEPVERAPQSWKPLAREHWAKLPAEVRQEVMRREQETSRVLQESAEARRSHTQFREAIAPFEAMIRAEAGDPIRGIQNLLGFAYSLRTGSPTQKATLIANAIQSYGVDIDSLAAALDGKSAPAQQAPQYDPRVDQIYSQFQRLEQQRQQMAVQSAQAQIDEAAASLEFFEDLRPEIAEIMDLRRARGEKTTLKQAYERALALSEDHQKIIRQREAAKRAASASAQTQRARVASSSVRSTPAVAPPRTRENTSLREDLEETLRELQGQ